MAFYAIGDLHLSGAPPTKPMDVFGPQWKDHREKIIQHWKETIGTDDTIILCGDTSWSMDLSDAIEKDFSMLSALPGKKIILKGNHDYWWSSMRKLEQAFKGRFQFLHNSCVVERIRPSAAPGDGTFPPCRNLRTTMTSYINARSSASSTPSKKPSRPAPNGSLRPSTTLPSTNRKK